MINQEQQASQSTPSPYIDIAADTCMFESAYSISVDQTPIAAVIGTQIALKQREKVSLQTGSVSIHNPLCSLISNSSESSLSPDNPLQASFSARKRHVTKIKVQGPLVRQLGISPANLKDAYIRDNISPQGGRSRRHRRPSQQKIQLQRIKDKLNRSALNRFFSEEPQVQLPSNIDIQTVQAQGVVVQVSSPGVAIYDWRPVVCRQTQQFLHSNDKSQKSEYKHFKPFVSKKRKSGLNLLKTNEAKQTEVLTSQQQSPLAQQLSKVLHINEVQFEGRPATKHDPNFAQRVIIKDTEHQNTEKANKNDKNVAALLINSCSERQCRDPMYTQEVKLQHNETAKHSIFNTSTSQITSTLMPKMQNNLKKSETRPSNLSQLNIDASVLGRNPIPTSVTRKNSEHKPITIPSARKPEQELDYFTDGSLGTEGQHTQYARNKKIGTDRARRVLNKSAYMKKNSLKNYISGSQSTTRILDEYHRAQAMSKKLAIQKKRMDMISKRNSKGGAEAFEESERGTNINNEDLMHVVQTDVFKNRNEIPSPLLSSQTFKSKNSLDNPSSPLNLDIREPGSTGALQQDATLRYDFEHLVETTNLAQTQQKFRKMDNYIVEDSLNEREESTDHLAKQKSRLQTHTRTTFGPCQSNQTGKFNKQQSTRERNHVAVITSQSRLTESYLSSGATNHDAIHRQTHNRSKKQSKNAVIGKKKMKALQDRVQNAIEFKDKRSPLTFCSRALITPKVQRQLEVQKCVPNAAKLVVRAAEMTSEQSSNQQLWTPKMHEVVLRNPNETSMLVNTVSQQNLLKTLQKSEDIFTPPNMTPTHFSPNNINLSSQKDQFHQPVKLRLFDLQGIKESADDVGTQRRGVDEIRVTNNSVENRSSIYKDEIIWGQQQQQYQERKLTMKVIDDNLLSPGQRRRQNLLYNQQMNQTVALTDLSSKHFTDTNITNLVDQKQTTDPRQRNTSTVSVKGTHWLSRDITIEELGLPHHTQYIQKFSKKQMSVSSQPQEAVASPREQAGLQTEGGKRQAKVQNHKKPSMQQVVIDDQQSNDTKYFTKSRAASIENQMSTDGKIDEQATLGSGNEILQQQQKMRLLELSSKSFSLNTAQRVSQPSVVCSPFSDANSISVCQSTFQKTIPLQGGGQQSYQQMRAFIDRVIQMKGKSNPVQKKLHEPNLKKHTGFSKIMKGVAKAQTPAATANKRQSHKFFATANTEKLQQSSQPPMKLRVGVTEPSERDLSLSKMPNPVLSVPNVKVNKMMARHRYVDKRESRDDMMKTSQLRLKPFHHSLVTQNYELLAQQIRITEDNFIKYSQALNTSQLNKDSMTQLESADVYLAREDGSAISINPILHQTSNVQHEGSARNYGPVNGYDMYNGIVSGGGMSTSSPVAASNTITTSGAMLAQANLAASMNQIQSSRFSPQLVLPTAFPGIHMGLLPSTERELLNDTLYEPSFEETKLLSEAIIASRDMPPKTDRDQASTGRLPHQVPSPDVVAMLYENGKESCDNKSSCQSKTVSPLMNKSRQNSLAHVYKQLHPGGTQKQWGLLMRSIKSKAQARGSQPMVSVKATHTTDPHNSFCEESKKFNKDLQGDGAGSTFQQWQHSQTDDLIQPLELLRQKTEKIQKQHQKVAAAAPLLQLPPVLIRAIEVGGMATHGGDCESPLAEHAMFPMLSPTTANAHLINQRQVGAKRRTGRILRTHAGRFK